MALLKLDEQSMTLNAIAGAQEEYKPSDRAIVVSVKVQKLKEKMTAFQKREQEFIQKEVMPELNIIREEIQKLNEETYPELKKMREQQEQKAAPPAKPPVKVVKKSEAK
jgi:hypothetical protein